MKQDFWHERWQKNQIAFHQQETSAHLEKYWSYLGMKKNTKVFVPLCGKSLDMIYLQKNGHEVIGVEIDQIAVEAFFAENKLTFEKKETKKYNIWKSDNIVIFQGDFFLLSDEIKDVSAIYDRASLVALPSEMRKKYSQHLGNITAQGCKMLLVVFEYSQEEMNGPPFSVNQKEVKELFENSFEIEHLETISILEKFEIFQKKGLTKLSESIYILTKKIK